MLSVKGRQDTRRVKQVKGVAEEGGERYDIICTCAQLIPTRPHSCAILFQKVGPFLLTVTGDRTLLEIEGRVFVGNRQETDFFEVLRHSFFFSL